MKRSHFHPSVTAAFLTASGAVYLLFLWLDLRGQEDISLWLKDLSVLLCLCYALLAAFRGGDRLIPLGLGFAVAADAFLLVAGQYWPAGILLFLCVQGVCLLRLRLWGAPSVLPLRLGLTLLLTLLLFSLQTVSLLNLLAVLYFSQLLSNTVLAWHLRRIRFAAALTLFVCCDACIGLYHAVPLTPALSRAAALGMWLFYLPAQVLFSLCTKECSHETK